MEARSRPECQGPQREVRRVFLHHILEDEVDGQKEEQGDKREDGEEGEESGFVEERQQSDTCMDGVSADPNLSQTCAHVSL